jgi:hypothetical protein
LQQAIDAGLHPGYPNDLIKLRAVQAHLREVTREFAKSISDL